MAPTSHESATMIASFSSRISVAQPSSFGPQNMPALLMPPTGLSSTSIPVAIFRPGKAMMYFLPETMLGAEVTIVIGSSAAACTLHCLSLSFFGTALTSKTSPIIGNFFSFFSFLSFLSFFSFLSSSFSFLSFFFFLSPNMAAVSSSDTSSSSLFFDDLDSFFFCFGLTSSTSESSSSSSSLPTIAKTFLRLSLTGASSGEESSPDSSLISFLLFLSFGMPGEKWDVRKNICRFGLTRATTALELA
mmetsp:Transcript_80361/g.167364  ORF Transcript_80361/g.167364 Transcript_80361/m.167364 type:complete len:246 (-) Transcript_80361:3-740(-)